MPNRILREGILTSERMERLNWAEEVFYRRLMSVVDDFGRYYARPALLLAACYPLLLKKVSDSDIEKWLSACENAALVRVYPAEDGKRYLQLMDFKQQVRAGKSKFPQPPSTCAATATQTHGIGGASAHLDVSGDGVVSEGEDSREVLTDSPPDLALSDFTISLNDGTDYAFPAKDVAEWERTFQAVDVPQELREMAAWAKANPTRRKTRRGVSAFAVRWLGKAQDTPGRAREAGGGGGRGNPLAGAI